MGASPQRWGRQSADRADRERRFGRWRSRLRKLGSLKLLLAVPVLAFTIAENLPATALASLWPRSAEERLTRGPMLGLSARLCTRAESQAALRRLVERLDPVGGRQVTVRVHDIPAFQMTALPGSTIEVLRQASVDTDAEQFAALLAHEISHVRHGDAMAAVIRENGFLATLGLLLRGDDNRKLVMTYSGGEEDRADREAIAMLRRAGIPLAPAAGLFERIRKAEASGDMFAAQQRNFHFGIGDRAAFWARAAAAQTVVSPISQQDADDLFNLCWAGPIEPATRSSDEMPPPPTMGGRGSVGGR